MRKKKKRDVANETQETLNVYRTSEYVVKQSIHFVEDSDTNTFSVSEDMYYLRNEELDERYEEVFSKRKNIDGKRIKVAMYTRKYF